MKSLRPFSILFLLVIFGQIFADTGGVIGVISPRSTFDGRPLLWQNFDSDEPGVQIIFFKGRRYHFLGLINGQDTTHVYSGLNTAGFGIVTGKAKIESSDSLVDPEAILVKKALGRCGRIDDFDALWEQAAISNDANVSIACIDAFGGIALYEAEGERRSLNPVDAPDGFFVRANFNFGQKQFADDSFWRYHRARELLKSEGSSHKIKVKSVVQKVSRDLQTIEVDPYPLPFTGQINGAPIGYIKSENSVNQYNTVAGIVIHGVRPKENPDFSTLWVTLGEPLCGVAVPLWPASGESPYECHGKKPPLNRVIQGNKRVIYNKKDFPKCLDSKLLINKGRGLLPTLNDAEEKIFKQTQRALATWRQQPNHLQNMLEFQTQTALWATRAIKY